MTAHRHPDRRWIWCALIVVLGLAAMLIRIPTSLGVQVPETQIPGLNASLIDTSSHETVWRVWWRARDDFVTVHPQWLLGAGLLVLLAMFVAGFLAAIWFALEPEANRADSTE